MGLPTISACTSDRVISRKPGPNFEEELELRFHDASPEVITGLFITDHAVFSMITMPVPKLVSIALLIITGLLICGGFAVAAETGTSQGNDTPLLGTGETNQTDIPNLVGIWNTKTEGTVLMKSGSPGEYTHWSEGMKTLIGKIEVTGQEGRVLRAKFTDDQGKEEKMIGAIHFDNKRIVFVDMDGKLDCELVDQNTMHLFYSQITVNDSVIAVGTAIRES